MRGLSRFIGIVGCACLVQAASAQSFMETITLTAGDNAKDVVVMDVNGDGAVDLAVSNRDGDSVSVFLNSGSGVFVPGVGRNFAALARPFAMATADFDGDGNPDLVLLVGHEIPPLPVCFSFVSFSSLAPCPCRTVAVAIR